MSLISMVVFAAEGQPPDSALAQLSLPLGFLVFFGSTYMVMRASLGTKRAYLVLATVTFGFMFIMSLFWGFGSPGTPQYTGPTNLPGQAADALQPRWVPFAQDSRLADSPQYDLVKAFPEGFTEMSEAEADEVDSGISDARGFFSSDVAGPQMQETWAEGDVWGARAPNGNQVIAVEFIEVDDTLEPVPDGDSYIAFAFFDAGAPILPSLLFAGVSIVLFLLHLFFLDRDERRERRELAELAGVEHTEEKVPANA